jgi:hypothetical protein
MRADLAAPGVEVSFAAATGVFYPPAERRALAHGRPVLRCRSPFFNTT